MAAARQSWRASASSPLLSAHTRHAAQCMHLCKPPLEAADEELAGSLPSRNHSILFFALPCAKPLTDLPSILSSVLSMYRYHR